MRWEMYAGKLLHNKYHEKRPLRYLLYRRLKRIGSVGPGAAFTLGPAAGGFGGVRLSSNILNALRHRGAADSV